MTSAGRTLNRCVRRPRGFDGGHRYQGWDPRATSTPSFAVPSPATPAAAADATATSISARGLVVVDPRLPTRPDLLLRVERLRAGRVTHTAPAAAAVLLPPASGVAIHGAVICGIEV